MNDEGAADEFQRFMTTRDPDRVSREWVRNHEAALDEGAASIIEREISMTVRVYTKPQCKQCDLTKNLMKSIGIGFIEEDITEPQNLAAAKALGLMSAPVVVVGEEAWAGFQPDRIKDLAGRIK